MTISFISQKASLLHKQGWQLIQIIVLHKKKYISHHWLACQSALALASVN